MQFILKKQKSTEFRALKHLIEDMVYTVINKPKISTVKDLQTALFFVSKLGSNWF